jgi:hypothetical protein
MAQPAIAAEVRPASAPVPNDPLADLRGDIAKANTNWVVNLESARLPSASVPPPSANVAPHFESILREVDQRQEAAIARARPNKDPSTYSPEEAKTVEAAIDTVKRSRMYDIAEVMVRYKDNFQGEADPSEFKNAFKKWTPMEQALAFITLEKLKDSQDLKDIKPFLHQIVSLVYYTEQDALRSGRNPAEIPVNGTLPGNTAILQNMSPEAQGDLVGASEFARKWKYNVPFDQQTQPQYVQQYSQQGSTVMQQPQVVQQQPVVVQQPGVIVQQQPVIVQTQPLPGWYREHYGPNQFYHPKTRFNEYYGDPSWSQRSYGNHGGGLSIGIHAGFGVGHSHGHYRRRHW